MVTFSEWMKEVAVITAALAIGCMVVIYLLYIVSGGWKTYGGWKGIFKWLKGGGLSNTTKIHTTTQNSYEIGTVQNELMAALDDIYRDFTEESMRLRLYTEQKIEEIERDMRLQIDEVHHLVTELKQQVADVQGNMALKRDQLKENEALQPQGLSDPVQSDSVELSVREQEEVSSFSPLYFEILDSIQAGLDDIEISHRLGIPVAQVSYVRQIMTDPQISNIHHLPN